MSDPPGRMSSMARYGAALRMQAMILAIRGLMTHCAQVVWLRSSLTRRSNASKFDGARATFSPLVRLLDMVRLPIHLTLYAVVVSALSLEAWAAGPPVLPVPLVPNTAQERLQTQMSIQQAQAQASLSAQQAKIQAQLDANQARLQGQMAAQQAGVQAQADAARERTAAEAQLAALSLPLPVAGPVQALGQRRTGNMELTALTPRLGRYFGTDHGILVVRAPTHGVLNLEDGDVILSIGGRTPVSSSQAIRILTSYDPGEKIRLVVLREHRRVEITTTMSGLPAAQ